MSWLSQQAAVSEGRAVHNPSPPPAFQVGCPSLWSLTGTREREGSFGGIPGITLCQANAKDNPSKTFPLFSPYYICSLDRSWTLDRKPLRVSLISPFPFTQLRSFPSNKTFCHHRCNALFLSQACKTCEWPSATLYTFRQEEFLWERRGKPDWIQTNPNA